jgi:hypothetical protein
LTENAARFRTNVRGREAPTGPFGARDRFVANAIVTQTTST